MITGGDGSFLLHINMLLNAKQPTNKHPIRVGIIPSGTGNDFYFGMGNPAIKNFPYRIICPKFVNCDIGRCEFLNKTGQKETVFFAC